MKRGRSPNDTGDAVRTAEEPALKTASGKPICASQESLDRAEVLVNRGLPAAHLTTASGKCFKITKEDLDRAAKTVEDMAHKPPAKVHIMTASGKRIRISRACLERAQDAMLRLAVDAEDAAYVALSQGSHDGDDVPCAPPTVGLTTASGKVVHPKGLKAAKDLLRRAPDTGLPVSSDIDEKAYVRFGITPMGADDDAFDMDLASGDELPEDLPGDEDNTGDA